MLILSHNINEKREKNFLLSIYRFITIAFGVLLLPFIAAAGTDSLLTVLKKHSVDDTIKVRLFIALADEYKRTNTDSTLHYARHARLLSEKLGFTIGKIKSLQQLGYAFTQLNELDTAATILNEALFIARQSKDLLSETTTLMAIGNTHFASGKYDSALVYYKKCLAIAEKNNDSRNKGSVLMNIGCMYSDMRKYSECIDYYMQALSLLEKGNYQTELANCYTNLSLFYTLMSDFKKALHFNELSLNIFEKTGNRRGTLATLTNQGSIYADLDEHEKAISIFEKAILRADSIGDQYWKNICMINCASAYFNLGNYDKALSLYKESLKTAEKTKNFEDVGFDHYGIGRVLNKKEKYADAIKELLIAFNVFKENEIKDPTYLIADQLSLAYEQLHNTNKALEFKKIYAEYVDSLFDAKSDKKILQLQYDYEISKKERKILKLQDAQIISQGKAEKQQILVLSFGIGFFLLLCIVCVLYWNRTNDLKSKKIILKKNEEIEYHISELESLNQFKNKTFSILSHDLKSPINSLSSAVNMLNDGQIAYEDIKTFIPEMGKKLDAITFLLDNLLLWAKGSMEGVSRSNPSITCLSEIAAQNIELFKDIAASKSLVINNNIPNNLTAFCDPTHLDIIFRNLIANAIKFSYTNGIINFTASLRNNTTEIAISDNGVGMTQEQLDKLFSPSDNNSTYGTAGEKGTGIGLLLCYDYLKANNGTINVSSEPSKGTIFTIVLPHKIK